MRGVRGKGIGEVICSGRAMRLGSK